MPCSQIWNLENRVGPALSKVWNFVDKKDRVISIRVHRFLISGNNRDTARFGVFRVISNQAGITASMVEYMSKATKDCRVSATISNPIIFSSATHSKA